MPGLRLVPARSAPSPASLTTGWNPIWTSWVTVRILPPESQVPLPGVESGLEGRGQRVNETRVGSPGGPWFSKGHGGRSRSPQSLQTGPGLVRCSLLWGAPEEAAGAGRSVGRKPTFLKEQGPPELDANQNKKPGAPDPPRGHLPGGTPEEMVEADTWPWPLAVMAATSMV